MARTTFQETFDELATDLRVEHLSPNGGWLGELINKICSVTGLWNFTVAAFLFAMSWSLMRTASPLVCVVAGFLFDGLIPIQYYRSQRHYPRHAKQLQAYWPVYLAALAAQLAALFTVPPERFTLLVCVKTLLLVSWWLRGANSRSVWHRAGKDASSTVEERQATEGDRAPYKGVQYWEASAPPFNSKCWPQYMMDVNVTVEQFFEQRGIEEVWVHEGAVRLLNRCGEISRTTGKWTLNEDKVRQYIAAWERTSQEDLPELMRNLAESARQAVRRGCERGEIPREKILDTVAPIQKKLILYEAGIDENVLDEWLRLTESKSRLSYKKSSIVSCSVLHATDNRKYSGFFDASLLPEPRYKPSDQLISMLPLEPVLEAKLRCGLSAHRLEIEAEFWQHVGLPPVFKNTLHWSLLPSPEAIVTKHYIASALVSHVSTLRGRGAREAEKYLRDIVIAVDGDWKLAEKKIEGLLQVQPVRTEERSIECDVPQLQKEQLLAKVGISEAELDQIIISSYPNDEEDQRHTKAQLCAAGNVEKFLMYVQAFGLRAFADWWRRKHE